MKRTEAREIALRLVFEARLSDKFADEVLSEALTPEAFQRLREDFTFYGEMPDANTRAYIETVVRGVCGRASELDEIIKNHSQNWRLERISNMSLSIMRVALFEMLYVDDVPPKSAINEAVELAKKYDTEEAPKFINGVLGSIIKDETILLV